MAAGKQSQDAIAVHGGKGAGKSVSEPEVAPIFASAVFKFSDLDQVEQVWTGKQRGYVYSRMANPNIEAVEDVINSLEGGLATIACSSGMAATALAVEAAVKPGGRIVAASVLYGATRTLIEGESKRRGVTPDFVDITDLEAVERALSKGAGMLFCECISNPLIEVPDLEALSRLAHNTGALFAVDNTFATPMLLKPLAIGADIVIHSCTKYLNGHDDVMAGTVTVGKLADKAHEIESAVRSARTLYGPILSPFEAWLLLRGIRTLGVRMSKHCENASALASALRSSGSVKRVLYPEFWEENGRSAAKRLLTKGFGGMLSFEIDGGLEAVGKLISGLKMASFVPSLGSFATTVSHPASTSHRGYPPQEKAKLGITDGLVRVSVGIEDKEDIMGDFLGALSGFGD